MRGPETPGGDALGSELVELMGLLRRVVARRVGNREAVEDVVQETIARLLAARHRLDGRAIGPYALVTARNLVASQYQRADTEQRHQHRLVERATSTEPEAGLLEAEDAAAVRAALERLAPMEQEVLVAHVIEGRDLNSLASELTSTPGAVAAKLNRSRAKLRVEYLLALDGKPPTPKCRPVLLALSAGDRRRQAELDAGYHLLDCDFCASLSEPLLDRRSTVEPDDARVMVQADEDVVVARQRGREVALRAGFSDTEATVIATAVSEIARNIVRFARRGEVRLTILGDAEEADGVMVVASDAGPGIADVDLAVTEGYSTYGGLGLGLPGVRRLMDVFDITSEVGRGTTVTMTKWHRR